MRASLVVIVMPLALLALARCAGCSEDCLGENQGAEGCPCAADQDCSTQLGILMCEGGSCAPGAPDFVPGALGACSTDDDCGPGTGCGVDRICLAAPECQRVDVPVRFHVDATEGDVTGSLAGCTHTWSADAGAAGTFSATFDIALGGALVFAEPGACSAGRWFAARRVGELVCGGVTWAISPAGGGFTTCLDQACDDVEGCLRVGEVVGVCGQ